MAIDWTGFRKGTKAEQAVMRNTAIMAATTLLANVFNYIFYFYIAKVLGPEKYSVFGTLLSIYFVIFFLTNIMNYIVIEYVSYFKAKTQYDKIRRLFDILVKSVAVSGFLIFMAMLAFSSRLKLYIGHESATPIIFLGLFLWSYIVLTTLFGMLNGMQKFLSLGMSRVVDGFFTLVFGIIFLSIGMEVSGGMLALFFAALLTVPFAIVPLRFLFNIQPTKIGDVGILQYVLKALLPSLFVAIMLNVDVILVKILFDSLDAGYFAAASLMGKIVFFVSTGMLTVIFPKAAELHSNGEDTSPLLRYGLVYTGILGFGVSLLYLLFPGIFAHVLFGREYQIAGLIGLYALSVTFLSLTNVFVMYNMAIRNFGISFILVPFTVIQITVLSIFHSSLRQVLLLESLIMFLMFISIIYFNKEEFAKMFRKTTGYRKYPISAFLNLKTGRADDSSTTTSRKIKVKEIDDFLPLDEVDFTESYNKKV